MLRTQAVVTTTAGSGAEVQWGRGERTEVTVGAVVVVTRECRPQGWGRELGPSQRR